MYFAISISSPLGKGRDLNELESSSPKDALCQVWLKLTRWFWWRRFFKMSSMYICYFVIISPWKRAGPFIWTNLNPLHPRMHCDKLVEIGPFFLEEKIFFKFRQRNLTFRNYLPLEKGVALHSSKLGSPSRKDALCQVCLKLTKWFWKRFFYFVNVFSLFPNYPPW